MKGLKINIKEDYRSNPKLSIQKYFKPPKTNSTTIRNGYEVYTWDTKLIL